MDRSPTIRTFRAPDTRAALAAVKAALGPDAVIVSTRSIPRTLLRPAEVEVTAALAPPEPPPAPAPAAQQQEPAPTLESALAGELAALRAALAEARQELRRVSRETRTSQQLLLDPAAARVYDELAEAGVEPALAEELVRQARSRGAGGGADTVLGEVHALLATRLRVARAPWLRGGARVVAFIGPTGVGKTTTLAKIAARTVIESRRKVALITVDTYRVGASDQIARYGEILGAPTFIARDREELLRAVTRCADADLVLIDTAGRSTSEAVAQQAESIRTIPGLQMHLVVSAAAGARELAAVAERYRSLAPERVIVSKVDEAAAPGGILSALVRLDRPVSCIANGQRVPEDLHAVEELDLLDLVLGSRRRERAAAAGGR